MKNLEDILETFSNRIKEIRDEKGWSIKQFADFVGIPRTTVNSWANKLKTPRIDALYQIADALGVTIDYLVGREEY